MVGVGVIGIPGLDKSVVLRITMLQLYILWVGLSLLIENALYLDELRHDSLLSAFVVKQLSVTYVTNQVIALTIDHDKLRLLGTTANH